jgi:hypothetical protein
LSNCDWFFSEDKIDIPAERKIPRDQCYKTFLRL